MRHCLILVAMLLVQLADAEERPDRVILLIGQSNMAGRAPLEEGDAKPIEGVLLLDGEGKWIAASNPLNRFATDRKNLSMQRIGPGFGFAGHLAEQLKDEKIGLVVNARGGSSINLWKPGETLYDHTLARLKAAGIQKVDAVIWHQGDSDAQDPEYLEKLVALVSNLRRDLGAPRMPFIAGEVFKDLPVNERMRGLPLRLKNTAVVSAGELKVFDGVHFDRESQLILGRRYAEALLKMLEGTTANVPPQGGRKHPHQEFLQLNTDGILFICGGIFEGLDKIVEKRLPWGRHSIGFTVAEYADDEFDKYLQHVTTNDLLEYGFIPEFAGRLPVIVSLDSLDKDALIDVLTEPKNSLVKQYKRLFELDNVILTFTPDSLAAIAEEALKQKTGARALRTILENTLLEVMYELPSLSHVRECVIDVATIRGHERPRLLDSSGELVDLPQFLEPRIA